MHTTIEDEMRTVDLPELPEDLRRGLRAEAGRFCVGSLRLAMTLLEGCAGSGPRESRERDLREARDAFLLVEDLRRRFELDPSDEEVVAALMANVEERLDAMHPDAASGAARRG